MANSIAKWVTAAASVGVVAAAAVFTASGLQAPPRPDLKPFAHWVCDPAGVAGGKLLDRAGKLPGTITGKPTLQTAGPTACLEFAGPDDGVVVNKAVPADAAFLPKEAFTVVAWVRVDAVSEWGGFLGCLQDNGPAEKGFVVGFEKDRFTFGLATKGADDGDGMMTYLAAKTPYRPRAWHHVAATYDGTAMKLFVNGKLEGVSDAQSGPVLYAAKAPLCVGRYKDDDEDYGFTGAIREVLWCDRAVPEAEIVAHFRADEPLAAAAPEPTGPAFVIEPYLQNATRTAMTVMCETSEPTTAVVEYGDTFPPQLAAPSPAAVLHEVVLSNLKPKTKYFYRVVCTDAAGKKLEGRHLTFMTAVGPADAWSFAVVGDTQANPKVTAKVAKLMWERRPHFVLHCGDVVDDGASKRMWTDELFKPCLELFGRVPVFPCIGNHEKNHANYYKYFSLPKPEYYYSYKYGNAEFFSLDTNKTAGLKPGGEQYQWLDKALAASDAKWKICYHHHPIFSSDGDDYGNTEKGASADGDVRVRPLQALYEKHNVDLVFNGHIHLYERSWPIRGGKVDPTGVVHVTSGGGGGRLEDVGPTPTFFKAECRVDFHFCYLAVHGGTLNFKAFDQEGRLFDVFAMKKD